jgi:hypothetical protein
MADFLNKGDNSFNEAIFQHNYRNIPIPSLASANLKTYADAIGTNSILYSVMDYKAKKSSQIKPIIVREVKDKTLSKEFYKWNGKFTDAYEIRQHNKLRKKAFEEISFDEINDKSDLFYLKKLLTNPNAYQTWSEFIYAYSMFEDLAGWSLMTGEVAQSAATRGKFTELYQLPTHLMDILGGSPMEPVTGYKFKSDYKTIFDAETCIRISGFNPDYDLRGGHLYGLSKVRVAWELFQSHAEAVARQYSSNAGGDLRAIITPKSGETFDSSSLGGDENTFAQRFKDLILRSFRQKTNQRMAIVAQPIEAIQFQNALDSTVTTSTKLEAKNDVAAVWGIDPSVVFPTESGTTYTNQKDKVSASLRNGVFPSLQKIEEKFREEIVKKQYNGYSLIFDYDVFEELTKDQTMEMETLEKLTYLSDNEKRERIDYEMLEDARANTPRAYWDTLTQDPIMDDTQL